MMMMIMRVDNLTH